MNVYLLLFALGIWCVQQSAELPSLTLCSAACLSWGGAVLLRRLFPAAIVRRIWLGGLACLLGVSYATWRGNERLESVLPPAWEGVDLVLEGVVTGLPQATARGQRFEFVPERLLTVQKRAELPAIAGQLPTRLLLSSYRTGNPDAPSGQGTWVRAGERWQIEVRLKRPHGASNPHGFDYEAWLFERGIGGTGTVRQFLGRVETQPWSPEFLIARLRESIRNGMETRLPVADYPLSGVLVALAIGDQKAIRPELWAIFQKTGITHLVSISGLHVTMLAGLMAFCAQWVWRRIPGFPLRRPASDAGMITGLLTAFVYTLLAGFAIPAQRTLWMLAVVVLARLSATQPSAARILSLALVVVLLLDPWAVLSIGFWLSFAAVAGLLYVFSAWGRADQERSQPIRNWLRSQWAVTWATLPLLVLFFQQVSWMSPLANALAIPIVSLLVTPLALLGAILPWAFPLITAHLILEWLMGFLAWCAQVPSWQVARPDPLFLGVAAVGVLLLLLPRGVSGRALGGLFLLPCLFWPVPKPAEGALWVRVLDVGQGNSILLQTRNHRMLYDPGPAYGPESDAGQRVVLPYLRTQGIEHLDLLMVSHQDKDHAGASASIESGLEIHQWQGSYPGANVMPCLAGQNWVWDGVRFEVLYPLGPVDLSNRKASNHQSCVLRVVSAGGHSLLIPGDIAIRDERSLLNQVSDVGAVVQSDVLVLAHHGSRGSSSPAFLAAVQPKHAIASVGYRNRFRHPDRRVQSDLAEQGIPLWRTDRDGAILIDLPAASGEDLTIQGWRRQHARYWHLRWLEEYR